MDAAIAGTTNAQQQQQQAGGGSYSSGYGSYGTGGSYPASSSNAAGTGTGGYDPYPAGGRSVDDSYGGSGSSYGGRVGGNDGSYGGGGRSYASGGYSGAWGAGSAASSSSSSTRPAYKPQFHTPSVSVQILPAISLLFLVALLGMLRTAHQMEHNPEGTSPIAVALPSTRVSVVTVRLALCFSLDRVHAMMISHAYF